ncbi:MAG: hypothetical protein K2Q03_02520 [Sphingobacteriaceae bacterium]|nr:hypothetical protein [Sphingobacteriaceae bacterium]
MKKIKISSLVLIFIVTISISKNAFAQNYTKFKGHLFAGYATPGIKGAGLYAGCEPSYLIKDNISVGFKVEKAITLNKFRYNIDEKIIDDIRISLIQSILLTSDYYFSSESPRRFFAGGGLGYAFVMSGAMSGGDSPNMAMSGAINNVAALIRVGAEIEYFRFTLGYNLTPRTTVTYTDVDTNNNTTYTKKKLSNSYLNLGVSIFIGGGYKKKSNTI